jgi:hypothetical protein
VFKIFIIFTEKYDYIILLSRRLKLSFFNRDVTVMPRSDKIVRVTSLFSFTKKIQKEKEPLSEAKKIDDESSSSGESLCCPNTTHQLRLVTFFVHT